MSDWQGRQASQSSLSLSLSLSLSRLVSLSLSRSRVSCLLRRAVLAQFGATLARAIAAEKRAGRVLLLCMKCVCVCVSVPCGGSSVVVFLLFPPVLRLVRRKGDLSLFKGSDRRKVDFTCLGSTSFLGEERNNVRSGEEEQRTMGDYRAGVVFSKREKTRG